jgi:hypothetical protein
MQTTKADIWTPQLPARRVPARPLLVNGGWNHRGLRDPRGCKGIGSDCSWHWHGWHGRPCFLVRIWQAGRSCAVELGWPLSHHDPSLHLASGIGRFLFSFRVVCFLWALLGYAVLWTFGAHLPQGVGRLSCTFGFRGYTVCLDTRPFPQRFCRPWVCGWCWVWGGRFFFI